MSIIGLFILLLVFCVIWWAATKIMASAGVEGMIVTIVQVVIVLVFLVMLAGMFGYGPGVNLRL